MDRCLCSVLSVAWWMRSGDYEDIRLGEDYLEVGEGGGRSV